MLLLLLCAAPAHGLHKPIQRVFEIMNSLIRLAVLHRFGDTMLDMLFQYCFTYLIKRGTYRSNLCKHLVAVPSFCPQPLEAVGVAGDARKPSGDLFA